MTMWPGARVPWLPGLGLGPRLAAVLATPPGPGPWACSLGRLGLFLGKGWGSGAGFRCSKVNGREREQMAGGLHTQRVLLGAGYF